MDPIFGGSCVPKPLPVEDSNITGVPQAARKLKKKQKLGVNKEARSIKLPKLGVRSAENWEHLGKNICKSTKMSEISEKMGNPMPFERLMGPNRHMENYGDLQPIARSMKPTLLVPSENLSFGLLPYCRRLAIEAKACFLITKNNNIFELVLYSLW